MTDRVAVNQEAGEPVPPGWIIGATVEHAGRRWRIDQAWTSPVDEGGRWTWVLVAVGEDA